MPSHRKISVVSMPPSVRKMPSRLKLEDRLCIWRSQHLRFNPNPAVDTDGRPRVSWKSGDVGAYRVAVPEARISWCGLTSSAQDTKSNECWADASLPPRQ